MLRDYPLVNVSRYADPCDNSTVHINSAFLATADCVPVFMAHFVLVAIHGQQAVSVTVTGDVASRTCSLLPVGLVEVLLYVHRNRRLIRDGSPGRPPRLSHSS